MKRRLEYRLRLIQWVYKIVCEHNKYVFHSWNRLIPIRMHAAEWNGQIFTWKLTFIPLFLLPFINLMLTEIIRFMPNIFFFMFFIPIHCLFFLIILSSDRFFIHHSLIWHFLRNSIHPCAVHSCFSVDFAFSFLANSPKKNEYSFADLSYRMTWVEAMFLISKIVRGRRLLHELEAQVFYLQ